MAFIDIQAARVIDGSTRAVYPESLDPNILKGAARIAEEGIAIPVLIGAREEIEAKAAEIGVTVKNAKFVNPVDYPKKEEYAQELGKQIGLPKAVAEIMLKKPLYFASMMVRSGDADIIVAGIETETSEVVAVYKAIIGMEEGIETPSCLTIVEAPQYKGGENNVFAMADMAINIDPTAEELADIAIASAHTMGSIIDDPARIAMLSFSTLGSSNHEKAKKIAEATRIAAEREPELYIDGEMQLDAAVMPDVAARKFPKESKVAGKANVLIFPSLDAGNIALKLLQRMAGANSSGGVLQGFAQPVCDLSRGATDGQVYRNTVILTRYFQGKNK